MMECFRCHARLFLMGGCEWPDDPEQILCSRCEKEWLQELLTANERLANRDIQTKTLLEKIARLL